IREKQLGPNHPDVATSLNNLASLLKKQGKLDAAEPLFRRSLEISEKQLGPNHPYFATSLNNLALLLWHFGRLDAALPLQERATSIFERRGDAEKEAEYRGELDQMRQGADLHTMWILASCPIASNNAPAPASLNAHTAVAFYRNLKGFLVSRDKLNNAAPDFMPTNGAAAFDDVGGGDVVLLQDLGGTAVVMEAQLDALYLNAPAAKKMLDAFCRRLVIAAGLDPDKEMIRETRDGEDDKVLRAYSAGPLKGRVRATEKAKNEYNGDAARLVDVVRGSIVCGDEASLVT
ncbi:Tetratricopeptide repeat-domain-containing protein, partial [Pelagophyceae sp. CCMP2097]